MLIGVLILSNFNEISNQSNPTHLALSATEIIKMISSVSGRGQTRIGKLDGSLSGLVLV